MTLDVKFNESDINLSLSPAFGEVSVVTEVVGGELYEGAYEVTPAVKSFDLKTKDKLLVQDLTIHAIPYYEVDNIHKGQTVIIGGN